MYSEKEKATQFDEISFFYGTEYVLSKLKISSNSVAFSENLDFMILVLASISQKLSIQI